MRHDPDAADRRRHEPERQQQLIEQQEAPAARRARDLGDESGRHRNLAADAQPLEKPQRDELPIAGRERAGQAEHSEDGDGPVQDHDPPVAFGEPAEGCRADELAGEARGYQHRDLVRLEMPHADQRRQHEGDRDRVVAVEERRHRDERADLEMPARRRQALQSRNDRLFRDRFGPRGLGRQHRRHGYAPSAPSARST